MLDTKLVLYNVSDMLPGLFESCSYWVNKYVRLQFILFTMHDKHHILTALHPPCPG